MQHTKKNLLPVAALAAFFAVFCLCNAVFAASAPSRTLRMGDTHPDVRLLQVLLNTSADTRVSDEGPGSPGQETEYFGAKTKAAVERFQAKYAADILVPAGASAPTGFVGPATLKKLSALVTSPAVSTPAPVPSPTPTPVPANNPVPATQNSQPEPVSLTKDMDIPSGVNPNSINLEYFIEDMRAAAKQEGVNEATLVEFEANIRATAASTTDFRKQFFESANFKETDSGVSALLPQFSFVERILLALGLVREAHAVSAMKPFGGKLYYVMPCICSNTFLLGLVSPGPQFPKFLTYKTGTQLYLSKNIPRTTHLLGLYTLPPICLTVPPKCPPPPLMQGIISPTVGSSPL